MLTYCLPGVIHYFGNCLLTTDYLQLALDNYDRYVQLLVRPLHSIFGSGSDEVGLLGMGSRCDLSQILHGVIMVVIVAQRRHCSAKLEQRLLKRLRIANC